MSGPAARQLGQRLAFEQGDDAFMATTASAGDCTRAMLVQPWSWIILQRAVLARAADWHFRMLGVIQRIHETGRAMLCDDAGERALRGDGIGDDLLHGAVVPVADDGHDLDSGLVVEDLVEADRPVAVDRVAGQAADLEHLALLLGILS